jgi:glycosyltransferase involved in cell wall biosynthesis
VRKVTRLLRDGERRAALGSKGREWANTFSWDVASEQLEDLLVAATAPEPTTNRETAETTAV